MSATPSSRKAALKRLILNAMSQRGWSYSDVARAADDLGLSGFSESAVRNRVGDNPPGAKESKIRAYARVFGEDPVRWLDACGLGPGGGAMRILDRNDLLEVERGLVPRSEVSIITAQRLAEETREDVLDVVAENLRRGVTYRYYYPRDASPEYVGRHPYQGSANLASASNQRVREMLSGYSFNRRPRIVGTGVDATEFPYFSALHTIVVYKGPDTEAVGYASATRAGRPPESEESVPFFYRLPDAVTTDIMRSLWRARAPVGDVLHGPTVTSRAFEPTNQEVHDFFSTKKALRLYQKIRADIDPADEVAGFVCDRVAHPRAGTRGPFHLVDVGCGDGSVTTAIVDRLRERWDRVEVTLCDSSRLAVEHTRERLVALDAGEGRVTVLNSEPGFFERFRSPQVHLVLAVHSWYTIEPAYLQKVYRLLAPGGEACIVLARPDTNVLLAVRAAVDEVLGLPRTRVTVDDLLAECSLLGLQQGKAGFRAEAVQRRARGLTYRGKLSKRGKQLLAYFLMRADGGESDELHDAAYHAIVALGDDEGGHPLVDHFITFRSEQVRRRDHRPPSRFSGTRPHGA